MPIELKRSENNAIVSAYFPYYREQSKKETVPFAINLYESGKLEGERQIEGGPIVPFVATWRVSGLPEEVGLFRVIFNGDPELSYEVTMKNSEFINYLIDVIITFRNRSITDFPKIFYSRLFRIKVASESN
jgi:hypothetical protein